MRYADAIVFEDLNRVGLGRFELPPPAADEILVRTAYTFVSPGTEGRVLAGHYGAAGKFPLIPGYSAVGQVVEVGPQAKGWQVGDWVSGRNPRPIPGIQSQWGGQAGAHVYHTTGEDRPVLLPSNAEPLDYVLVELAAIALRGIEAARVRAGEAAVVIGQGLIGALSAAWLSVYGCRVAVVDLDEARLERATRLGAGLTARADAGDVAARVKLFAPGGADIVVEASGSIQGVELAYHILRKKPQAYGRDYVVEPIHFYGGDWPRLVMQANYIEKVSHDPHNFHAGEGVTILSPRDRGLEERRRSVEALRRGQLRTADFLDLVTSFQNAPEAYEALQRRERFSVTFEWTGTSE